ncbi:hypothetical protein ET989_10545 [Propioniciclava sinopodophylli]|uniref:Uncharacterized protein n=1 Tax=Propioniciclava sinopodophylli TaxID=1837344 RepID=A0A4Q9KC61_9ACTN|nr:hypothetical protein [Propioniciclava sinopodophylli]TBT83751.1 hypothetical protein ET989_10545 [Propioniciclava sinopodophylli]
MTHPLTVDFLGERYHPSRDVPFTIGRDAALVIDDDNGFLHRQFLSITFASGLWWLSNVGTQLTATVSHDEGRVQAWLAPEASLPLVFEHSVVWFTAGATTYDFELHLTDSLLTPMTAELNPDGSATMGRVTLTPDQRLLVVALCEHVLRRGDRGAAAVPQSAAAAARLGWPVTKFNRKLDAVCSKLADTGVRGLHGGPSKLASSRKARLVEYAMAARIVTADDLELLPPVV